MEITTLDTKLGTLSNKYQLVETKLIAQKFKDMGFTVDKYQQAKVRKKSKEGYQRHLVSLSNPTLLSSIHSDTKLQVLVTNSHDGLNSFCLQLGIYRFACANGLVIGSTFEKIRLRHTGLILEQIEESVMRIVAQAKKLDEVITNMKNTVLTSAQQIEFTERALKLRYPTKTIDDVQILTNRPEDTSSDVFTFMNRIQENLVRGQNKVRNNKNRIVTARELTSIPVLIKLNEDLFDLSLEYTNAA